jgi:hypothetical protein
MGKPEKDLSKLLRYMDPVLRPGVWAFVSLPPETPVAAVNAIATFRESEGLTAIVPEEVALSRNWDIAMRSFSTIRGPILEIGVVLTRRRMHLRIEDDQIGRKLMRLAPADMDKTTPFSKYQNISSDYFFLPTYV